ncbi:L-arabinitol 4-dehydrogenase [Venturia nashicola]|uniref:Spindle pole body component n=1 Tax=Venturia nashicola TaxID=86259 RepID=A0A4Z1PAC3_9PEZI|nr:L-arabinitol 4-dehydrogenase [Venturia nashicola]TLD38260.1 L-arabinitol 4-dehydrogenase [Venturia nashicola]
MDFEKNRPFKVDLWQPSSFFEKSPSRSHLFSTTLDASLAKLENPYFSDTLDPDSLKLPDLDNFHYGPLSDLSLPDGSTLSSESEPAHEVQRDDIWQIAVETGPLEKDIKYYTWEAFQHQDYKEPCSAYVSEAGPRTFDAALQLQAEKKESISTPNVIQSDSFLQSLFALGLGRSSVLFTYDGKLKSFTPVFDPSTTTGLSQETSKSLVDEISACGNGIRHLKDFVERTYGTGKAFSAKIALANTVDTTLSALEVHLSERLPHTRSLLQLQEVFSRPSRVVSEIEDVVEFMASARSNEAMASLIFERCQRCEQEPEWLRSVLSQFLARVSKPWLESAEEWLGVRDASVTKSAHEEEAFSFVRKEETEITRGAELDHVYRPEAMPSLMSPEDGQRLFEVGRSLRILRVHHPEHPLSHAGLPVQAPPLTWAFDWCEMNSIVDKAKAYEQALAEAVREYGTPDAKPLRQSRKLQVQDTGAGASSDAFAFPGLEMFNTPAPIASLPDELMEIIATSIVSKPVELASDMVDFSPPISLAPVLSFNPLLAAQSRLVNAASLRLFFRSHHLRTHLDLQRSFHLLGDGVFIYRLTAALFDPNLSTTERQLGVMRSGTGMGLRLGARGTWPPASSELRLALMGILTDCYQDGRAPDDLTTRKTELSGSKSDLPGSLSFAIRHLDEKEAEKILDPDSLHALDFLRLQYYAPSPLGAVLTPMTLDKYDDIFKFLLRLSRLVYVVGHLPKNFKYPQQRRFRMQVTHFVTTCAAYFFDTGVGETWDVFAGYLNNLEQRLNQEDEARELGTRVTESLDDLREQHEICLDRMAFALLLRHRQRKVLALLEDIFGVILEFAKECNFNDYVDVKTTRMLQGRFQDSVRLFLDVCRGLIGKRGYGKGGGESRGGFGKGAVAEENTIERLVVALDWSGFYGRV